MLNYLLLGSSFFENGFRDLTFLLDTLVYKLAQLSFSIFCYLSRITLLKPDIIDTFIRRIYVIIGLVMVFVIAYNLLNYIIDPDKVNDKNVGASAFIKDIIIALAIITILPVGFRKAYSLQNTIIEKGIISNIFLGGDLENVTEDGELSAIKSGANITVANVYSSFVTPTYEGPIGKGFSTLDCGEDNLDDDMDAYCNAYYTTINEGNIDSFKPLIKSDKYRYWPLLSTVGGIVLSFFMLSYCINLGIRAGKLALLTIIAPIPALMEIIPGKKETRKKWAETLLKTYLDVFIYQATVFMIIYIITLIPDVIGDLFVNVRSSMEGTDIAIMGFTLVFLVFGLLQFGKEAPKMVSELLGIKDSGTFDSIKKRAFNMFGATTSGVGAAISGGLHGVASGIGGMLSAKNSKEGFAAAGKGLAKTAGGIVGGLGFGMYANRNGGLKGVKKGISSGTASSNAFQKKIASMPRNMALDSQRRQANYQKFMSDPRGTMAESFKRFAGSNYDELNQIIASRTKAKDFFKNVTKGDNAYEDATRILNEAKASTNYATDLKAYLDLNPKKKEKDYIQAISNPLDAAYEPNYNNIVNAFNQQEAAKEAKILKKKDEIINNALGMMQYIELNPQIASDDVKSHLTKLNSLLGKDGTIISGDDNDIQTIYTELDDLSTQLGKENTATERVIQNRKLAEEARKARSGDGDKKDK